MSTSVPEIDLSDCSLCGVCVEVAPQIFQINAAGYVEVCKLADYPQESVDDAIKNCPEGCIGWST